MALLTSSCTRLEDGVDAVTGSAAVWRVSFTDDGGAGWASGDTWVVSLTVPATSVVEQFGLGDQTSQQPTFVLTLANKVYLASGKRWLFSASGLPTTFSDLNAAGNGWVESQDQLANVEDVVALAKYQGKLAVFGRTAVQIWRIAADPLEFVQEQVLDSVGTLAPLSVGSTGFLDVLFLADSGVRSLRVRDSSNSAAVTDVGAPVDLYLANLTDAQRAASCCVVEPNTGQYWLYVPSSGIWVFAGHPTTNISAWSKFEATDSALAAFVPQKFAVQGGLVYVRTSSSILIYGGSAGTTYDATVATWETQWMDAGKPATRKVIRALDAVYVGAWTVGVQFDFNASTYATVLTTNSGRIGTYEDTRIPVNGQGTHYSVKGSCSAASKAVFSAITLHYKLSDAE